MTSDEIADPATAECVSRPAAAGTFASVELFFPVSEDERDALLRRAWTHAELAGLQRIQWDDAGVDKDAIWVAAELPDDAARRYEEPDSRYLGYRSFVLPGDVLDTLGWRVVGSGEVAAAAQAEADAAAHARARARQE
jgi:hypothetical protein